MLGDETLRTIARELGVAIRGDVTTDWTMRERARPGPRGHQGHPRKYGYPPDMRKKATQTVVSQAEVLSEQLAVA